MRALKLDEMYKIWMEMQAAVKNTQATRFTRVQTENDFTGGGVDESSFRLTDLNQTVCETEKEL